jgi:hypothetical protein
MEESNLNRLLPKSLIACSQPFLTNLGLAPGDVKVQGMGISFFGYALT